MLAYKEYPLELFFIPWVSLLVVTLLIAVYTDLKLRKIHNKLTFTAFFIMSAWLFFSFPIEIIQLHGLSLLLGSAIFLPLFYLRGIGGGDVKLLLLVCLSFRIEYLFSVLLWITLTGGVQGIASLAFHKRAALPYAVAITGGTLMYLATSWYF